MHILITGINGRIGSVLAQNLHPDFTIRGVDRVGSAPSGIEFIKADITQIEEMKKVMDGVEIVIHLAGNPSPEAPWDTILENNIIGTYNIFESARLAGVKRVIYASSNHVTGLLTDKRIPVNVDMPAAPDSFYGVSKLLGENLGRYYSEVHKISVICLRIGNMNVEDDPAATYPNGRVHPLILRLMWISQRDLVQLVRKCILVQDLPYAVFYGTSGNTGGLWDISDARQKLHYEPLDDSMNFKPN
jgi:NAD+ dependent glucose-6-phosphate dehydrogenase